MPTVEEVLRQSGFNDQQIAEMDQRAITAFSGVLTSANQQREAAELAQRNNVDFYENRIAPSLVAWDEEKQRMDNERARAQAEVAFYRTQNEQARAAGFVPTDAPGYQPPRDGQGRYVAGAPGATPGSPTYFDVSKVYEKAGDAVGILSDIQWEHERLFGKPMPISPTELVRRADAVKLDPRSYASREFNFDGRRAELQKAEQEKHDEAIRKDATAAADRRWSEKLGSNPDMRVPMENVRMSEVAKAVRTGSRVDPLLMNDQQRRVATSQAIREEIQENSNL